MGMDPVTIAIIGAVVSTGVQVMAAHQQARAQQAQFAYQAGVQRNNAIIAERNAQEVEQAAPAKLDEHRERIKQSTGTAVAQQAANGFLVDDDEDTTNPLLIGDIAAAGQEDLNKIHQDSQRQAFNIRQGGAQQSQQAALAQAKADSTSPLLSGATAAVGGIGAGLSRVAAVKAAT